MTSFQVQQNSIYLEAGYPDRLGPSGIHFLTVNCTVSLHGLKFSPIVKQYKELCINVVFVRKQIFSLKQPFIESFSIANCQCSLFSKKNSITRISCIFGWFAVPLNPDKRIPTVMTWKRYRRRRPVINQICSASLLQCPREQRLPRDISAEAGFLSDNPAVIRESHKVHPVLSHNLWRA